MQLVQILYMFSTSVLYICENINKLYLTFMHCVNKFSSTKVWKTKKENEICIYI